MEYGTAIVIRQVKYLNNLIEQDHRGVKRVTRPMLGLALQEHPTVNLRLAQTDSFSNG